LAAATSRLKAVAETLATLYPAENEGWTVSVRSLRVGVSSTTRAMLFLAMGAVTFVLLIACANVANLTLARATARRRELATRLALGATAGRIVRQMVTESLLLAVLSVPFGIALACWARRLLLGERVSPDLDRFISIDANVVMFSIGLAFLTSVLSGLVPALHAVGRLQQSVIGEGGSRNAAAGPAHTHLSQALVVVQVSLCLMLLVGASLLIKSFRNALQAEGGFDTSAILAVTVESAEDGARVTESVAASVTAIVERLAAVPGVTHVAAANLMPLRDGGTRGAVVPDAGHVGVDKPPTVLVGGVTGEFFQVLGVPIRLGRSFTDAEGRSPSPVAVVNNTMARRLWPDQNPVGRRFRRVADEDGRWFTVVGVSDDILTWDLSDRPQPTAYLPYAHVAVREPRLLIRADGEPSRLAPSIRTAIHEFDSTLPILDVRTMTEVHYAALARTEMLASLFVALGVIALVLGAAGVYGVLSYFVSHRTQEIGIRAALGADRGALVRLFVRRGMLLTVIGIACGLMGAWALSRVVRGRLHDVSASDPTSFTGVTVLLLAVGLVASYLPARRAAHVDPLTAIRE
jgi:putative ABC transport system permease protein